MKEKNEPELILTFEWDGKTVHKETKNFSGKACTAETAFIEEALSAVNQKKKFKPEYLLSGNENEPLKNRQIVKN